MNIRFPITTILIAFAVVAVALTAVTLLLRAGDPFRGMAFDSVAWKNLRGDLDPDNPRAHMIRDLLNNHLREGMLSAEVVTLLGNPDDGSTKQHSEYILGMWSGFRMDYDVLEIDFDSTGRVSSIAVVQH
jgi:hypothetical protein